MNLTFFEIININNFDILVLLSSIALFISLFFVGRAISGPKQIQSIQIPIGMFVIYFFFIVGSAIKNNFSIMNVLTFLIIFSFIGFWRSRRILKEDMSILLIIIIFVSPLLIIALKHSFYLWDDYSNWLPPARYLFTYQHLPTIEIPIMNHSHEAYPYLRALIHSLINKSINDFNMNIQMIMNVLFGGSLLLWAKPLTRLITNEKEINTSLIFSIMSSFLLFLLIIWMLLLYPDNDLFSFRNNLLSSYSEAFYLIVIIHLFFYLILKKENMNSHAKDFDYVLAILLALPITIKDLGYYHSLMIFFIYLIVFEFPDLFRKKLNLYIVCKKIFLQLSNLIIMLITNMLWIFCVEKSQLNKSFDNPVINSEKFKLVTDILYISTIKLLSNKVFITSILIAFILLVFLIISKLKDKISNYKILLFSFLCSLGIIFLTLVSYVAVFSPYEAINAASFHRYLAPATIIVCSSIVITFGKMSNNLNTKVFYYPPVVIILIYIAIIFAIYKTSIFDENLDNQFKEVASNIVESYPKNESLFIIDLQSVGDDALRVRYYINQHMTVNYVASVHIKNGLNEQIINKWFDNHKNIHLLSASNEQLKMIQSVIKKRN